MTDNHILRSEQDGVLELTFNRPEKLNAITLAMFDAIRAAVTDLRTRHELRVLLIRATGRYFSAGVDLTEGTPQNFEGSAMRARNFMRTELGRGMHSLYEEMERVEKPIVVAHQGMCVGGGLEMSLSCDFRLAAKSAGYWFPEMQLGILPLSNGVGKLTRICGGHWAKWMVVANEKVAADHALTMGLVHQVYPDETFDEDARAFCRKLAGFHEEVLAAGKLAIEMAQDLPIDQARQLERLVYSSLSFAPGREKLRDQVRKKLSGE
jgi:enoyl-CoA hydratase